MQRRNISERGRIPSARDELLRGPRSLSMAQEALDDGKTGNTMNH
ncbi:hypothetical protein [Roseovarius dicentrarchi]|nr:hypothetical protein [Roseovarius dicentrarchi]